MPVDNCPIFFTEQQSKYQVRRTESVYKIDEARVLNPILTLPAHEWLARNISHGPGKKVYYKGLLQQTSIQQMMHNPWVILLTGNSCPELTKTLS